MKNLLDTFYFITDFAENILRGALTAWLIGGLLPLKKQFVRYGKWVFCGLIMLYVMLSMIVGYQPAVKKILYGNELGPMSSRSSTMPLLMGMLLILIYCMFFYGGMKLQILYLVLAAYTLRELVMFTIHPLLSGMFSGIMNLTAYFALQGNEYLLSHFEGFSLFIQIVWNLSFQIIFLYLLYRAIRLLKKNLSLLEEHLSVTKVLFLASQSLIGFSFCMFVRSIFFEQSEVAVRILWDEYPETYALIPIVSSLCVVVMISGAYLLRKLEESSRQELMVEIYQNRIADMEDHMKDVERLYDGIRGMRHDMKNYVADLEILLRHEQEKPDSLQERPDGYQEEIRRYFNSLYSTMEELEMPCNTGNPVTDVVLSRKLRQAKQQGVAFSYEFLFPEKLGISAFDVSILLNNGLENALEAASKEKNGYIKLESYVRENMFLMEIRNSFSGTLELSGAGEEQFPKSSKPAAEGAFHGYGLKNMKKCAEKYFSTVEWKQKEGEFLLMVMLQSTAAKGGENGINR